MISISTISIREAYFSITIAISFAGLSLSFVEFGLEYFTPFTFVFLRFFIATLILTPFILLYRKNELKRLLKNKWTWFVGLSVSFGLITQYLGQQEKYGVPAGLAALLTLLFLIIVPFISPFILNEKIKLHHIISMIIGIIGVYFIITEGNSINLFGGSITGILFLIGTAFCYAFYLISTSRLTTMEILDADTFTLFYSTLAMTAFISFFPSIFLEKMKLPSNIDAYFWLAVLIIFPTLIGFYAYFLALKRISANTASVLSLFQLLFPFAIDYIYLGTKYNDFVLLGSFLIIVAMIIVVIEPFLTKQK